MSAVNKRESLAKQIIKLARYARDLTKETAKLDDILTRQRTLESYWTRFQDVHDEVLAVTGKLLVDEQYVEFEKVEEAYFPAAARFNGWIRDLQPEIKPISSGPRLNALEKIIEDIQSDVVENGANASEATRHSQTKELDRLFQQYEQIALSEICGGAGDDSILAGLEVVNNYYRTATAELYRSTGTVNNQQQFNTSRTTRNNEINLPKIEMPTFDGTVLSWESFRDLYVSIIHNRTDLSDIRKFQYLKSCMRGAAEPLLRSFTLTTENYMGAWQMLLDRFDNKKALIYEHLRQLTSQSACKDRPEDLKNLLNKTSESLRALQNLGRSVTEWDDWVVFMCTNLLDIESRKLWEQMQCLVVDPPSWNDFTTFLHGRIRALEATSTIKVSSSSSSRSTTSTRSHSAVASSNGCPLCKKSHRIIFCAQFRRKSLAEKRQFVKDNQLCFNCVRDNHRADNCPSQQSCQTCSLRHHTMLHMDAVSHHSDNSNERALPPTESTPAATSIVSNVAHFELSQVMLATALVNIVHPSGSTHTLRVLLDQGSQSSFITTAAANRLQLRKRNVNVVIEGIGSTKSAIAKNIVSVKCVSLHNSQNSIIVDALVLGTVTAIPPLSSPTVCNWAHINGLQLADCRYHEQDKVDMLLGADVYGQILLDGVRVGPPGTPTAQHTIFGWILSGKLNQNSPISVQVHHAITIDDQLRKFWEVEHVNETERAETIQEKRCQEFYKDTYKRDSSGRFIVRLPFIDQSIVLGSSKQAAIHRQFNMEKRFARDAKFHDQYLKFMSEYESLQHMTEINKHEIDSINTNVYYIPHHAVLKETSTTTKLRVVFDASRASSNGTSLNQLLHIGPKLQQDLTAIIMRWRKHPVAFTADVEKMYRQITIDERDRDLQRIVWRPTNDVEMRHYRLNTVTYGTSAAPYLAIQTLRQLANDEKHKFPIGAQLTLRDFYVDDILSGSEDIDTAKEAQRQLIDLLQAGQFQLKKWASNRAELISHLPIGYTECKSSLQFYDDDGLKTLGINWSPNSDTFSFHIQLDEQQRIATKRSLLSDVARLYDPLGWLAPSIIMAKIIMQRLWKCGCDWDDPVPTELNDEWMKYRSDLKCLDLIKIPRWIKSHSSDRDIQLHGFCDASTSAYAAAVYVRIVQSDNSINVSLVTAKTKVAPIKTLSVPRLELCGAVLLAQLLEKVESAMEFHGAKTYAWTDSTIVLAWLAGQPTRWNVFVANRITTILNHLSPTQWNHVCSNDNPADCASRGVPPSDLQAHSIWWHGPHWLQQSTDHWPHHNNANHETVEEMRTTTNTTTSTTTWQMAEQFSSISRLKRVTAYIFRFVRNVRCSPGQRTFGHLQVFELENAFRFWIASTQSHHFANDIKRLKRNETVKNCSKLIRLTPFLDDNGILRVGGRLHNSILPFDERHPMIMPADGAVTVLIIANAHLQVLHGGTQSTLAYIRRRFWIIAARNKVRAHIRNCVICFRQKPQTSVQIMGNLPPNRINPARPFIHTAVDYSGFIKVRSTRGRGQHSTKAYIALFVCLVTKAIHLELVTDLTSTAFIAAYKRFTGRRGLCQDVYSDNGTNFVGANKELHKNHRASVKEVHNEIGSALAQDGTSWHFSPPLAPHFNGLAEAGIKSTKTLLKRIIGESTLTYEELITLLSQVEACLNSRPLSPLSTDPTEMSPLTPAHFLIGAPLTTVPEKSFIDVNITRLTRWQLVQQMYQQFWRRWSSEYFHQLYQRSKWQTTSENLKEGNMVLLKDDNQPPSKWKLGRITNVCAGPDGNVRVVQVRHGDTISTRPIVKLALLPIYDQDHNNCS